MNHHAIIIVIVVVMVMDRSLTSRHCTHLSIKFDLCVYHMMPRSLDSRCSTLVRDIGIWGASASL